MTNFFEKYVLLKNSEIKPFPVQTLESSRISGENLKFKIVDYGIRFRSTFRPSTGRSRASPATSTRWTRTRYGSLLDRQLKKEGYGIDYRLIPYPRDTVSIIDWYCSRRIRYRLIQYAQGYGIDSTDQATAPYDYQFSQAFNAKEDKECLADVERLIDEWKAKVP